MTTHVRSHEAVARAVKGKRPENRVHILVSLESDQTELLQRVDSEVLELFFRAAVLLNFGALGYSDFPLRVIGFSAKPAHFLIQVTQRWLSVLRKFSSYRNVDKVLLIAANRFPANAHIQLAHLVGGSKPIALRVYKYNTNPWNMVL